MIAGTLAITLLAIAQKTFAQPTLHAEFEVASVKRQPFEGQGRFGVFIYGNTLNAENQSLNDLVQYAYNLRDVQLSGGPAWATRGVLNSSELYQVIAKAPADTPPSEDIFRQMMQSLLADRFKLQIHHVQKDLPVYYLVVNKGGPKLKKSPADANSVLKISNMGNLGVRIAATHLTVQQLIDRQLSGYTDRPIFDKTGLTAAYDFTLEFAVEKAPTGLDPAANEPPALVTAVQQQLGLKLETGKSPFDTIVIDHAERPSQN